MGNTMNLMIYLPTIIKGLDTIEVEDIIIENMKMASITIATKMDIEEDLDNQENTKMV
jgi:hypothetical protein